MQEVHESLALVARSLQHVKGHVQRLFVAQRLAQVDIRLRTRLIILLHLQSGRQSGIVHITERGHVVRRQPLPQLVLLLQKHGLVINHVNDVFNVKGGFILMHPHHDGGMHLRGTKRHGHTHAKPHPVSQVVRNRIGKRAFQRQRNNDIYILHEHAAKLRKSTETTKSQRCNP